MRPSGLPPPSAGDWSLESPKPSPLFVAHEYERCKELASAALAYKCMEVAYMRVIYAKHMSANRDRNELQSAFLMLPPGESPSSSRLGCCSVDEDANEKLAPYSALSGDESYSNRDLEKVGSVYAPFFLFIAICAALRPLFTGYRVSTDVPASRKTLVQ
ncbi:hypothetical protein Scep_027899 [Stephania cephalantha]|uniref:CWZF3/5/7 THD domain-containing protein n=1 Tax=Stephania cephalantha TaxID=152367 RepID=A0AAP0EDH0_9MAGN